MNEIEHAYHEATEQWKAGFRAGVEAAAKIADQRPDTLDSVGEAGSGKFRAISQTAVAIRSLLNESDRYLIDEDEPDRYLEIPRSEDERLDDPQHGQAEGLNKLR